MGPFRKKVPTLRFPRMTSELKWNRYPVYNGHKGPLSFLQIPHFFHMAGKYR